MQEKALIAMSGGVDSSVAAYLMQSQGYDCIGATMRLCDSALLGTADGVGSNTDDALAIARQLNMPFHIFDATGQFRHYVVDNFVACYESGGTPNPCIACNRHLKFAFLLQKALELGCDYIVTGHYARVEKDAETGRYLLKRACTKEKDQSYFLSCLSQKQLAHIQFPLGDLTKEQVRELAASQNLITARKKDSQDICFIPDGDYGKFLMRYTQKTYPTGDYLDLEGNVVGRHSGAVNYTIGQRKGLGIALGAPVYVCSKDMERNTVTVGPNEALFQKELYATDWNWFPFPALTAPLRAHAKIRYRHEPQPATVYPEENGAARVIFDVPQRAITPGQSVVLYDGDTVIGGGIIAFAK